MIDQTITVKIKNLPGLNEREYAQYKYDEALRFMLSSPTRENIQTFEETNKKLFEIEDKYRLGAKLLIQFHVKFIILSRRLQTL